MEEQKIAAAHAVACFILFFFFQYNNWGGEFRNHDLLIKDRCQLLLVKLMLAALAFILLES